MCCSILVRLSSTSAEAAESRDRWVRPVQTNERSKADTGDASKAAGAGTGVFCRWTRVTETFETQGHFKVARLG